MAESVAQPRLRTMLLALFSAVALVLSLIGVYGVMAYAVSERTHEIGVRIALGASPADIRVAGRRARGRGWRRSASRSASSARWRRRGRLSALLFGVSATDPVTFALAARRSPSAGVAAAYVPARRAEPHRSGGAAAMNAQRVIADLRELAARTSTADGAQRLAWGPVWRDARAWFTGKVAELGLDASRPTPPATTG